MRGFLNKQYDLLESKSFRYCFVFGGAGFALIFLWIFEPYGLYNLTTYDKMRAILLYVGTGMVLTILQFFVLQNLVIKTHTVLKTVLWIILSFLILGASSSIINSYLFNEGRFVLKIFILFLGIILSINIIPVSVFVLIHYNVTLKKRLKIASGLNDTLRCGGNKPESVLDIIINSENKREGIKLSINSLLYITSVDNYIDIFYLGKNKVDHKLVRYSLSGVKNDNLHVKELFRCHKSYIINKRKVESISGNAAGYKVQLVNCTNLIPISRKWNKDIYSLTSI